MQDSDMNIEIYKGINQFSTTTRLHEVSKKEESMKRKPKELKVRICFEKDMCIPSRLRKIDEVVKKIKTLEKSGEYRCTLLEIEV